MSLTEWKQEGKYLKKGKQILKIGSVIKYEATGTNYSGNWRIVGTDGFDRILLMSEQNVTTLELKGREDCKVATKRLNQICGMYGKGKGAAFARSATQEDVLNLKEIEVEIGDSEERYWLANDIIYPSPIIGPICCVKYAYGNTIWPQCLMDANYVEHSSNMGVRPIVALMPDVILKLKVCT